MKKCAPWAPSALLTRCAHKTWRHDVRHALRAACHLLPWKCQPNISSCYRGAQSGWSLLQVQCGFGRVGTHFWGFQTQGVVPDMVSKF